jgi:hypothetical protein
MEGWFASSSFEQSFQWTKFLLTTKAKLIGLNMDTDFWKQQLQIHLLGNFPYASWLFKLYAIVLSTFNICLWKNKLISKIPCRK